MLTRITDVSISTSLCVHIEPAGICFTQIKSIPFMWGKYLPVFSVLNGNSWEYVQNFENLFLPFIFSWWAKFSA